MKKQEVKIQITEDGKRAVAAFNSILLSVKRFTTVKTAEICRVSTDTILRWRESDVFSEYIRMPDGYMFPGTATVSRITKIKNGAERALTLIEIAGINGIKI